jgi:hypothetical protein
MPMRLVGSNCWITLRRLTDKDGSAKTYMFCITKQKNNQCPRDVKSGKRPYEIGPACFENMTGEDFLNDVIMPDILEPRPHLDSSEYLAKSGATPFPNKPTVAEQVEGTSAYYKEIPKDKK